MSRPGSRTLLVLCILLPLVVLLTLFLPLAQAAEQLQAGDTTTLAVAIHSSPIAVRDHNALDQGPRVFVVHAVVTNTGPAPATELSISLDYQENPATGWLLGDGEEPERTPDSLAPGESYHAFWFATYPAGLNLSHQYAVTASAANADPVSTTANVFDPQPDRTVQTRGFLGTGNNGQIALSSEIVVGVAFTMEVDYNLGQGSQAAIFAPAGNLDFDASLLRLQGVSVRFHNAANTQERVVADRLYFPTIPTLPNGAAAGYAEATYTFLALQPGPNSLCPYLGIQYQGLKYDTNYCGSAYTAVLTGTIDFDFAKQSSAAVVQEGERLTYTLHYSNTGTLPMIYTWIWDELDAQAGSLIPGTVAPEPDLAESTDSLLAWDLDWVDPGSTHTFTYAILAGGDDSADLEDGQILTNTAFFGINDGSVPNTAAVSATVTTVVRAPRLIVSKSDGLETVNAGQPLTYTIVIRNEGSVAAVDLSATDLLPDELLAGTASPSISNQTGQLLTWDALGDLAPGEELTITVPATVAGDAPSFTTLSNTFELSYDNPAGHHYQPLQAGDTTTVLRPAAFVEGTVFEDTNTNGVRDAGEMGLAGVQLSLPSAFTPTVTTDAGGFYRFRVESAGVHVVTESDPAGFISTTPNEVAVAVAMGQSYTVDFGDIPAGGETGAITGTVFEDEDGDGVRDAGEAGIPGVTVTLDGVETTTDTYGRYTFGLVIPGFHTVEETDPDGYTSTTSNRVTLAVVAGESYAVDFGDRQVDNALAAITGVVFEDGDGDGIWDPDEAGISGVTVRLDDDEAATTDATGRYSFGTVSAGLHTVEETDPPGYVSTTPNRATFEALGGESYPVDFGDRPADETLAMIYGTVFSDDDGDGQRDAAEAGLPGVTVALDGATTTTDAYGRYSFGAVAAGLYTLEESDPPGYLSTTPNRVVANALPGERTEIDFGDRLADDSFATLYGTVFDDLDADGVWDTGEPGLSGVTVALDGVEVTTGVYGSYSFGALAAGLHVVEETDLSGYTSTTPNRVAVSALPGKAHEVNFGDRLASAANATLYGTVFADGDRDAIWDLDEPGIPGVTVALDGASVTTDAYGSYSFGSLTPGLYVVEEMDLPGYTSTTPNQVTVNALAGQTVVVNFGDTGSCLPDAFEDDDDPAAANPLVVGARARHDFCGADEADWHAVTVRAGTIYTFTTDAFGRRADTILTLFAAGGQTVLAANDDLAGTTNFSSQIVWQAPASGTVYLRITNRGALAEWLTGYDVWVEQQDRHQLFLPLVAEMSAGSAALQRSTRARLAANPLPAAPAGVIDHCDPDTFEVDDSWELAGPVLSGVAQSHTFDSDPAQFAPDKDFVVFEVGPGGSLAASVESAMPVLLELYDAHGQSLNRSGVDALAWANVPMGRYILGVSAVTPAYSCDGSVGYELTLDYTPLYRLVLPLVLSE